MKRIEPRTSITPHISRFSPSLSSFLFCIKHISFIFFSKKPKKNKKKSMRKKKKKNFDPEGAPFEVTIWGTNSKSAASI